MHIESPNRVHVKGGPLAHNGFAVASRGYVHIESSKRVHEKGGPLAHNGFAAAATLLAVTLALALLAGCGSDASSGSGSGTPAQSSRELALERAQFEQVASELSGLEPAVKRELVASRAAWPAIADGLPPALPGSLRAALSTANTSAKALPEPAFLANSSRLTGSAAGIAGIYENYEQLAGRGWNLTEAAAQAIASAASANPSAASHARAAAQASFERANSPLYIDAIYDGHFDLSLLGKSMLSGYEKLGGPSAFGAALTQAKVNALAAAYSIPAVRLEPHPAGAAKDG